MRTKTYDIYIAGSTKIDTVHTTCISKACKTFIERIEKKASYKVITKEYATITCDDHHGIGSDFVVMEH